MMDMLSIFNDKTSKAVEKRKSIQGLLLNGSISSSELTDLCDTVNEKQLSIVLEAIEAVTNKNPACGKPEWLELAEKHIGSHNHTIKREASRIVGNLAAQFPHRLDGCIALLMANTKNDGTVVRWGSAYALGRIVALPEYAASPLLDTITQIYEEEAENGVKNQYLSGLKKANKLRR